MEQYVGKSQSLYSRCCFVCLILIMMIAFLGMNCKNDINNQIIIGIAAIGLISHFHYVQCLKKHFLYLIETCDNIINQKDGKINVIDGESYISVLSSHLYLLDVRMKGMIERLQQEHTQLKTYIEDISHQIKTPLTAMILKEDMLLEVSHASSRYLVEQMIYQTQKIQICIESLLQLAQVESHSINYHYQLCLFDDMMMNIEEDLAPMLEEYDVKLNIKGENYQIYGDFKWLSTAIENIIKNCIEQKEHSCIDVQCIEFPAFSKIIIHDHGQGVREEDLPHLFERFYRSQSHSTKGVGIGLAICKGVIDEHYGTIDVYNDQGAVFEMTLPMKKTKSKYTVTNE